MAGPPAVNWRKPPRPAGSPRPLLGGKVAQDDLLLESRPGSYSGGPISFERRKMTQQNLMASGGRQLTYLRLSVTDRCNLRCRYCMPPEGVPKLRHGDMLSYEELTRLCRVASGLGLKKLRLTGGEPLVRLGLVDFVSRLAEEKLFADIRLTTNGLLLPDLAGDLKRAGLSGLNISLDSLDPNVYAEITGRPGAEGREAARKAWAGFQASLREGFQTKINCVPIRGVNDGQLAPLARLALEYPVDVRFIEHMPIGSSAWWAPDRFMAAGEVLEILRRDLGTLEPLPAADPSAPARLFKPSGALGAIGFISPLSGHFCGSCNRLRLTSDGKLKPCLLTGRELDLRAALRSGADDRALREIFLQAAGQKPACHLAAGPAGFEAGAREMSRIGG